MGNSSIFGVGFVSLLTLIFVVAKLWGKLDWSWWWVFSPIWISLSVALIIFFVFMIAIIIIAYVAEK